MKLQKLTLRIVAALFALSAVACVDKDFRLDEVSTEVTLGQGKTIIPLGYLNDKTIGSMLGANGAINGLNVDPETGEFSINFVGDAASFEVDGVTNELEIPSMTSAFSVTYPEFDLSTESVKIHQAKDMKLDLGMLEDFGIFGSEFFLPYNIEKAVTGELSETITPEQLHFQVPEQINNILSVFFKDIEAGHEGAPLHLKLDLNDLCTINGGGKLDLDIRLDGGQFIMKDGDGVLYEDNCYTKSYDIKPGDETVEFVLYVDKIVNNRDLDAEHALDIPLSLSYDLSFEMDAKQGQFSLVNLPKFTVDADFEYGDADVALDKSVMLVEYHPVEANDVVIENIPEQIASIKSINLEADSSIRLFAHGLDWFGDKADLIEVDITLPSYLNLHQLDGVSYEYVNGEHLLKATLADLDKGLEIGLSSIEFAGEGVGPDANGNLHMDFAPDILVHFTNDAELLISSLMPEDASKITITTGIQAEKLNVESVSGRIAYGYEHSEVIQLGDLSSSMALEIKGEGLSPVVRIDLTNPLTLDAFISATLTPISDGVSHEENAVTFDNLAIEPAEYINGEIVPSQMRLVLAEERHREEYSDGDYTFVACEVGNLLKGKLPEALELSLNVLTNSDNVSTLYVADKFVLGYSYGVDVPLEFNEKLAIGYSDTIGGLSETFSQLAINDIKVGDVALLINFKNTSPLTFSLAATLLNADGEPTPINVHIPEDSVIEGSTDGVTTAESQMRLEIEIPNGDLSRIGEVEAIRFDFEARGASQQSIALKESHSLSAFLQMELDGGITIDFAAGDDK